MNDDQKKADNTMQKLASSQFSNTISIESSKIDEQFEASVATPFENTKTEYREWSLNHLQQKHTSTVKYTGDNDVTYDKECVPDLSNINVISIDPVYVPEVSSKTTIQDKTYTLTYYSSASEREIVDDNIHQCIYCGEDKWWARSFTYCENCGSINCFMHIETERVTGEPICRECSIVETFSYRKKFFSTEDHLEQFRKEYNQMKIYDKILENELALAGLVAFFILMLLLSI